MYQICVKTVGNPDFGQDPRRAMYGVPVTTLQAETLPALRLRVREFQHQYSIGCGNWVDPKVKLNSRVIGYMSYNGRVWADRTSNAQEVTA